MVDRLPMTSHKGNAVGVNTCLRADGQTGVSAEPAHQKVQKAQFLAASEIPRRHPQDAVAHGIGKRQRDKSQLAHLRSCRAAADLHQCGVNAIGRGAAHQTDGQLFCIIVQVEHRVKPSFLIRSFWAVQIAGNPGKKSETKFQ